MCVCVCVVYIHTHTKVHVCTYVEIEEEGGVLLFSPSLDGTRKYVGVCAHE